MGKSSSNFQDGEYKRLNRMLSYDSADHTEPQE